MHNDEDLRKLREELQGELRRELDRLKRHVEKLIDERIAEVKEHTRVWFLQAMRGGETIAAIMGYKKAAREFKRAVELAEKGKGDHDTPKD